MVDVLLNKALSDLGGITARVHDRTPRSVLRSLMNALAREKHPPTLANLLRIYEDVEAMARKIKVEYTDDLFETRPFAELAYVANASAHLHIPSLAG